MGSIYGERERGSLQSPFALSRCLCGKGKITMKAFVEKLPVAPAPQGHLLKNAHAVNCIRSVRVATKQQHRHEAAGRLSEWIKHSGYI